MSSITRNQWLGLMILASSILMGGASQLDILVGVVASKAIVAGMILLNAFLAGAVVILGGQGQQVKDVLAMQGVQKIDVNAQANTTLAKLATDPTVDKIGPTPAAMAKVEATAKGV